MKRFRQLWCVGIVALALGACDALPPNADIKSLPGSAVLREELGACDPMVEGASFEIADLLGKNFGHVAFERYKLPRDASWAEIVDHYGRQLPKDWPIQHYAEANALFRLKVWGNDGWPSRYLAVALLDPLSTCPNWPNAILIVAVPGRDYPDGWH